MPQGQDEGDATMGVSRRTYLSAGAAAVTSVAVVGAGWRTAAASAPPPTSDDAAVAPDGAGSAKEAVSAYLTALAAGDADAAAATFAVDRYVDGFDLAAYLARVGAYQPFGAVRIPVTNPFNRALAVAGRRAVVVDQILRQYFAIAMPEFDTLAVVPLTDDAAVEQFVAEMETALVPDRLAGLADHEFVTFEDIDADAAATWGEPLPQEQSAAMAAIVGADEAVELAVRSTADGQPIVLLFRTVAYDDGWWLEGLGGQFAAILGVDGNAAGVVRDR